MGRSRYKVYEQTHPHFLTCTVLHWLAIFTNQASVQILLDSFTHLQKNNAKTLLKQFAFHKKVHRKESTYQSITILMFTDGFNQEELKATVDSAKKHYSNVNFVKINSTKNLIDYLNFRT